jgi:DnaD/phage-associated family protein
MNGICTQIVNYNNEKYSITIPFTNPSDTLSQPLLFPSDTQGEPSISKSISKSISITDKENEGRGVQGGREQESPETFKKFLSLYEQSFGAIASPSAAEVLKDFANTYSLEWFEMALNVMKDAKKRNLRYLESILQNWQQEGQPQVNKENNGGTHQRYPEKGSASTDSLRNSVGAPLGRQNQRRG